MKHLKIAFAIMFFCLLEGFNTNLIAQYTGLPNKIKVGDNGIEMEYKNGYKLSSSNEKYLVEVNQWGLTISSAIYSKDAPPSITERFNIKFPESAESVRVLNNGNLVALNKNNDIIWQTGTAGRGGSGTHLQIQNDGNLVLYNGTWYGGDGDALWATGTCDGIINSCGATGPR
jgi:hypothetical protein